MSEKIYIIGHKSPDLDSVAGAIVYAKFRNAIGKTDKYSPVVAGDLNKETEYVLSNLGLEKPEVLTDLSGKQVILVDHNEKSQAVDGLDNAVILEVLDHHKIDFKYNSPVVFKTLPWGASCTIIAEEYLRSHQTMDAGTAKLLLSAILVDTVITKSPTCTDWDKDAITKLSEIAGIKDWQQYGLEIFKIRSNVKELSSQDLIKSDFKDFSFKAGKFGIGQVETVDLNDFAGREDEIMAELSKLKETGSYHTTILFITDIIKEGSKFFVVSDNLEAVGGALKTKMENGMAYIDGIISRKKQVAPVMTENFDK